MLLEVNRVDLGHNVQGAVGRGGFIGIAALAVAISTTPGSFKIRELSVFKGPTPDPFAKRFEEIKNQ